MTRLHCVSGVAGLALLVAAGCPLPGRNVLVVANEADAAEVVPAWWQAPGAATLTDRFDAVVSWNEVIAPLHPRAWQPPALETPMLARMILARLPLDTPPTELVVESLTAGPGRALATLVPDVPITVVAASPLVYGPSAGEVGSDLGERITRLVHVDLVPGLRPLLVRDVPTVVRTRDDHLAALAVLPPPAATTAVLLDEGWAAAGALTVDEEFDLHRDALRDLVAAGHRSVTLAPDPAADPADRTRLTAAAADLGVTLTVGPPGVAHEAWLAASPDIVVGTAAAVLHLATNAKTIGTRLLLERLAPYENPARIPVTVADLYLPALVGTQPTDDDPEALLDTVSYCMRSNQHQDLRERAQNWVDRHSDPKPYLRRKRLEAIDLVPSPQKPHTTASPPAAAKVRSLLRRNKS